MPESEIRNRSNGHASCRAVGQELSYTQEKGWIQMPRADGSVASIRPSETRRNHVLRARSWWFKLATVIGAGRARAGW